MPAKRKLTMRQLRHLLRLNHDGASSAEIARQLGRGPQHGPGISGAGRGGGPGLAAARRSHRRRAGAPAVRPGRGRSPGSGAGSSRTGRCWRCELKRPGVTLMMLWEEYRESQPEGYGYSRFCDLFREFERHLSPVMRQHHVAGDKVFVDYSGKKIGDHRSALPAWCARRRSSSAVLGASSYTYAEATWTQTLPDWIGAHVRMFGFFGGVPRLVVPDNLKSRRAPGVVLRSRDQPQLRHDGRRITASASCRPGRASPGTRPRSRPASASPRAASWAGLRRQTFFSLAEANAAIAERPGAHQRPRHAPARRQPAAAVRDPRAARPGAAAATPITSSPNGGSPASALDYHVEVDGFFYSVPHALIREQVDVRATARTVEMFHRGQRVAAHQRRYGGRRHGTEPDHMPSAHRRYAEWTPERFRALGALRSAPRPRRWSSPSWPTGRIPSRASAPASASCGCSGISTPARAEAVAARAVAIGALTYKSIASILANNLDRRRGPGEPEARRRPSPTCAAPATSIEG